MIKLILKDGKTTSSRCSGKVDGIQSQIMSEDEVLGTFQIPVYVNLYSVYRQWLRA